MYIQIQGYAYFSKKTEANKRYDHIFKFCLALKNSITAFKHAISCSPEGTDSSLLQQKEQNNSYIEGILDKKEKFYRLVLFLFGNSEMNKLKFCKQVRFDPENREQ